MFSRFKQNAGQASVEAALFISSYSDDYCIACRAYLHSLYKDSYGWSLCRRIKRDATTSSDTELIESYIKRRLKAVPEIPLFHKGGDEDWNISIDKKRKRCPD